MIEPRQREVALEHISDLAGRASAAIASAGDAILQLARDLLGPASAMVTRAEGGRWWLVHVVEDADDGIGVRVGERLPSRAASRC